MRREFDLLGCPVLHGAELCIVCRRPIVYVKNTIICKSQAPLLASLVTAPKQSAGSQSAKPAYLTHGQCIVQGQCNQTVWARSSVNPCRLLGMVTWSMQAMDLLRASCSERNQSDMQYASKPVVLPKLDMN